MRDQGLSDGRSSAGYDCGLGRTVSIAKTGAELIDLTKLPPMEGLFAVHEGDSFIILPGMLVLIHVLFVGIRTRPRGICLALGTPMSDWGHRPPE